MTADVLDLTYLTGAEIWQQVLVFFVGSCLGSFYNVIIYRLPAGESIVHPRSKCPHCGVSIAAYDNIPILSYLILRGRCRSCGGKISFRYPLVEALTGSMAWFLFTRFGWSLQFGIEFFFVSLLILITFIDLATYLIPDVLSLPGVVLGFALSFVSVRVTWLDSLMGILLGGGFFYLVAVVYERVRQKEGLGGGDIKMLGMIGAFIGWPGAVFTVLTASVAGALVGTFLMWKNRKGLGTMLPFGPFLAFGACLYLMVGGAFFSWYIERALA